MSSKQSNTRRSMVFAAAAAATALYGGLLATPAAAQEAFILNADGSQNDSPALTTYNWNGAPWTPVGEFPGQDDTDDIATINFREFTNVDGTGDPDVDINLQASSFTIGTLNLTESSTGNTDGNLTNGTLNVSSINYTTGGREIDFETTLTLNGNGGSLAVNPTGANN